ncbi:DEAD_2 protein, partial [Entamoeba invadens IP1]
MSDETYLSMTEPSLNISEIKPESDTPHKSIDPSHSFVPQLPSCVARKGVDSTQHTQLPILEDLNKYFATQDQENKSEVSHLKHTETFDDLSTTFPYPPYPQQVQMLSAIQKAIADGKHLLLESPTGTGKTLVLLHAALSSDVHRIVYTSRTHNQLAQVVRECRKLKPTKGVILASRELYCVYDTIKDMDNNGYWCNMDPIAFRRITKKRSCPFRPHFDQFGLAPDTLAKFEKVYSITRGLLVEHTELVQICKENKVCPYHYSKWVVTKVRLVLCPYNFITNPSIRSTSSIFFMENENDECALVLDEAHNAEDSLMDAMSFDFGEDIMKRVVLNVQRQIGRREVFWDRMKEQAKEQQIVLEKSAVKNETNFLQLTHQVKEEKETHVSVKSDIFNTKSEDNMNDKHQENGVLIEVIPFKDEKCNVNVGQLPKEEKERTNAKFDFEKAKQDEKDRFNSVIDLFTHICEWAHSRKLVEKDEEKRYSLFDVEAFLPVITRVEYSKLLEGAAKIDEIMREVDDILLLPNIADYLDPYVLESISMAVFYVQAFRVENLREKFKVIVESRERTFNTAKGVLNNVKENFGEVDSDMELHFRVRCLSSSLGMSLMQSSVRSIIFASGTLSPMQAMVDEMKLEEHDYKNQCIVPGYTILSTSHV